MAKPLYFSHDSDARNDQKILMLRAEHGWEGYGIYWMLIEIMFQNDNTFIHNNTIKGLAYCYNIDITLLQSVITTCIHNDLFASDDHTFWSEGIRKRKEMSMQSYERKRAAGRKGMASRWGQKTEDNTVITTDNTVITKNNKLNRIKRTNINKATAKISLAEFVSMTEQEHKKLIDQHGQQTTQELINILDNYKGSSGQKYESDYRAILSWVVKRHKEDQQRLTPRPRLAAAAQIPQKGYPQRSYTDRDLDVMYANLGEERTENVKETSDG